MKKIRITAVSEFVPDPENYKSEGIAPDDFEGMCKFECEQYEAGDIDIAEFFDGGNPDVTFDVVDRDA